MKSWWFPLRSGFILDPKHRKRLGQSIWLLQYLFLYANRSSGGLNRKLGTIAKDLEISEKQVQRWMRTLEKHEYVKTRRLRQGYFIEVAKWRPLNSKFSPDTSVQSFEDSSDNSIPVTGQNANNDQTIRSQPDQTVRPITSFEQKGKSMSPDKPVRNKEILLKDSSKKKGGRPSPVINFLNFAGWAHKRFRRFPIVFNDQDRGRVQSIIDLGVGEKDLKRAWLLFLKSRDSWLEGKPRSIAIFKSQANDYLAAIPNPAPPPRLLETRLGPEEALEDEIMALWESWDNETDSCSNIQKRAQEILSREDISRSQIDALRFILEKVEEGEGFELEDEFVKA